jgi:Tfp pilus assembly protein PilX
MSKSLSPFPRRPIREQGATLVVTLLVMTLLSTIVVAFMQNVSSERNTSRSHVSRYQAELAAEAGLAVFLSNLANATQSGDFQVLALTANSSNQTFTAITKFDGNGTMSVLPLSSTNNSTQAIVSTPYTISQIHAAVSALFPAGNTTLNMKTVLTGLADIEYATSNNTNLSFPSQLATVPSTGNATTMEYAYVAVDECAKLNIALFGGNSSANPRTELTTEEFPKFVPVAGVGNHTVTTAQFESFNTITPPSSKMGPLWVSIYDNLQNRKDKNRFYSFHKGELIDFIPAGYWSELSSSNSTWTKLKDANKPKYDINKLALDTAGATANADKIAGVISDNLTSFYKRDPSFSLNLIKPAEPTLLYVKRLAASIVDYIDSDDTPTSVTGDALAGKERTPYTMQIAERYYWESSSGDSASGYTINIKHTVYVQLWNPYTVPVSGNFTFELKTFRPLHGDGPADMPAVIPTISNQFFVQLAPNQIKAFKVGEQSIAVQAAVQKVKADVTRGGGLISDPPHSTFKSAWNGTIYDQSAVKDNNPLFSMNSGLSKSELTLMPTSTINKPEWKSNAAPTAANSSGVLRYVADPRQNQINNYAWRAAAYDSGELRWNGASIYNSNSGLTQLFEETWKNRDSLRAPLPVGIMTPSIATEPTEVVSSYVESNDKLNAPFFISNLPMQTVAEFGHIYDPAHLDDSGNATLAGGTDNSYYSSGGARTLRIGQPELRYTTYNVNGQRALALLDLFTTANTTATHGQRFAGLNLNTAPIEVIASFFENIAQMSDEGQKSTSTPYFLSQSGAINIATQIFNNRPYFSASEMYRFTDALVKPTNFTPVFPSVAPTLPTGTDATLNVVDRGREEVFRRAYNYMETKSAAFRFYGIGRALSFSGQVVAQAAIEVLVELRATTDATGNRILKPVVISQRKL